MGDLSAAIDRGWSAILDALTKIIVPDWNSVISLLPALLIVALLGPVLTLTALAWLRAGATRRRGRVTLGLAAAATPIGDGPIPPNVPHCPADRLLHGPTAVECVACRLELQVICPIDETVRPASDQVCRACGTRYVLGAASSPLAVQRRHAPPPGGAAIA